MSSYDISTKTQGKTLKLVRSASTVGNETVMVMKYEVNYLLATCMYSCVTFIKI
jgi:hypothetical protein